MQRTLLNALMVWKKQAVRKPLLIDGARQTGKTFLLQELFGNTFANVLRIDFLENPAYKEAFDGSLSPDELLMNIELITNQVFRPETDLLILDETFDSSLDYEGVDNLMKIIHELDDDTNVFVISHKGDIIDGKFSRKIEFFKEKNFSKIK